MQKTVSVIDLGAVRENALKIRKLLGKRFFYAVVKADAYGHGAEEVARAIEDIADGFCVAIIDEGINLRVAGITKPVLVFTPPLEEADAERAAYYNLGVTVNSARTAELCKENLCHIKVNTGMNRSGCNLKELPEVLKALSADKIISIYSHMYAPENARESIRQLELFKRALNLAKQKNPDIYGHISASGGLLRGGEYLADGVRAGILLYGYAPGGFSANGFKKALKVYARRTQVTPFIGGGVGYNIADRRYKNLNVYRLGYADGFFRNIPLGEKTLCMDLFLSDGGESKGGYGGKSGGNKNGVAGGYNAFDGGEYKCVLSDAEEYARRAGTISYEVLTSVTRRSERIYIR